MMPYMAQCPYLACCPCFGFTVEGAPPGKAGDLFTTAPDDQSDILNSALLEATLDDEDDGPRLLPRSSQFGDNIRLTLPSDN